MHLTNFVKQTLQNRLKYVMNFTRHVQCRIKIGKVYFLKTGMCLRDLHVMVNEIKINLNLNLNHYLFCKNKHFHFDAKADCMCEYCNGSCDQYHINQCRVKKVSLREAAKIIKK
jgi:hypothetical protein